MDDAATHPTDTAPVIRWGRHGPELADMRWGFDAGKGGEPIINVRAETADLSRNRCLIPATDFELFTGAEHPKRRWKVTLKGETLFFFAGLWRHGRGGTPDAFAALTIEAAPDLLPLTDRQMAVIRPSDAATWLEHEHGAAELLKPLPSGSFEVQG